MAAEFGLAKTHNGLDERIEHRLQIERRTADDLEHLRRCRLLPQRFGADRRYAGATRSQSRVLDGDDGLGGEVLKQRDLLVGKGSHFLAIDINCADEFAVLQHRYRNN